MFDNIWSSKDGCFPSLWLRQILAKYSPLSIRKGDWFRLYFQSFTAPVLAVSRMPRRENRKPGPSRLCRRFPLRNHIVFPRLKPLETACPERNRPATAKMLCLLPDFPLNCGGSFDSGIGQISNPIHIICILRDNTVLFRSVLQSICDLSPAIDINSGCIHITPGGGSDVIRQ